jgi:hypothetical protein
MHVKQLQTSSEFNSLPSSCPPLAQVFNAIQAWRDMLPASEVVAQKVQGQEVQHAAALMGLHVNKQDRRSENEIIAMRVSEWWAAELWLLAAAVQSWLVLCCS